MDSQTQLQIVISLINDATSQLTEVSDQLASLGTAADEASTQITDSLTKAEQAAADAATNTVQSWTDSIEAIPGVTQDAYDAISNQWLGISDSAAKSATSSIESWQSSLAELQDAMAQTTSTVEDDFATMGESAAKSASSSGSGGFGYFHNLIAGLAFERLGSGATGVVQAVVSAAAGLPNQIAQLKTEIDQQTTSIGVNQAAMLRWTGTTAQAEAAHLKEAANIEAERVKIAELTRELGPLEAAYAQSGNAALQYNDALLQLQTDWQALLATIGAPFIAAVTNQLKYIDQIVQEMQKWAKAHPELAKEVLIFLSVLGPFLTVLGEVAIAFAIIALLFSSGAGEFLLFGAAIGIVAAAIIAFWPQIKQLFDYLNGKNGIIDDLRNSWNQLSTEFTAHLLPDLEKLWKDLQPLMPYLEKFSGVVGGMLLTSILQLAAGLLQVVDGFAQILDYATKVADYLTTHLEPILNNIKSLVNQFNSTSAGKAVGSVASPATSMMGGIAQPLMNSALEQVLSLFTPFAAGGIVNGPTLALVGEAGPEAIIPLSSFTGGSSLAGAGVASGGGNIQVFIQGGTYLNQGGAQQIASALATMIQQQIKLKIR